VTDPRPLPCRQMPHHLASELGFLQYQTANLKSFCNTLTRRQMPHHLAAELGFHQYQTAYEWECLPRLQRHFELSAKVQLLPTSVALLQLPVHSSRCTEHVQV